MFGKFAKKYWLSIVVLFYVILPIDLIPDAIPIVGTVDDSVLVLVEILKRYIDFKREKKDEKSGQA